MTTEERLTKLEEDLSTAKRRNRWTLASAALVLVAVVTAGNIRPPADEVKARRFTVVDEQGNTRAELRMNVLGIPVLQMLDAQGKTRAELAVFPDGSTVQQMRDAQGREIWSAP